MAMGCKVHDYLPLIGNVPLALANVPFGHFQQRLGHTRKGPGRHCCSNVRLPLAHTGSARKSSSRIRPWNNLAECDFCAP